MLPIETELAGLVADAARLEAACHDFITRPPDADVQQAGTALYVSALDLMGKLSRTTGDLGHRVRREFAGVSGIVLGIEDSSNANMFMLSLTIGSVTHKIAARMLGELMAVRETVDEIIRGQN